MLCCVVCVCVPAYLTFKLSTPQPPLPQCLNPSTRRPPLSLSQILNVCVDVLGEIEIESSDGSQPTTKPNQTKPRTEQNEIKPIQKLNMNCLIHPPIHPIIHLSTHSHTYTRPLCVVLCFRSAVTSGAFMIPRSPDKGGMGTGGAGGSPGSEGGGMSPGHAKGDAAAAAAPSVYATNLRAILHADMVRVCGAHADVVYVPIWCAASRPQMSHSLYPAPPPFHLCVWRRCIRLT